jgi:hypothetical protein
MFLLKYVKTSQKKDLVLLISRVLEINVPANFILSIILLGNEEVQKEVGQFLMLNAGEPEEVKNEKALVFFSNQDESIPLRMKVEMDEWIKNMLSQADEYPQKLLKTAYKTEFIEVEKEYEFDETKYEELKTVQTPIIQLIAYVLREYMEGKNTNEPYEKLYDFAEFILKGILTRTQESVENRKFLE